MQLEKAHTSGGTHVEFIEAGRKYRVDVKKMEQINTKSKVARKVQRICEGNHLYVLLFQQYNNIGALCHVVRSCYVLEVTQFEWQKWQFYIFTEWLCLVCGFKHGPNMQ